MWVCASFFESAPDPQGAPPSRSKVALISRSVSDYSDRADQARIILDIVPVKAPGEAAISLGHFAFPIGRPRKNHPLEITLGYDEHGMVSVVACDPDTGREVERDPAGSAHPMDRILAQKALLDSVPLRE